MDRIWWPQDVAFDRGVGDVVRELQVLTDLSRREVRPDGLAGDLQDVRQLLEQARRAELRPKGNKDLLLARGAREVAVADALPGSDVGERLLPSR